MPGEETVRGDARALRVLGSSPFTALWGTTPDREKARRQKLDHPQYEIESCLSLHTLVTPTLIQNGFIQPVSSSTVSE